jgi:signal transduction histidine kinase
MSHELRTPLNVILGFAEMARDAALDGPERIACIGRIEGAGRQLFELIQSTLEIGKLEAGREDVRLETVPLAAFWDDLGRACVDLRCNEAVALEWHSGLPDVTVVTDPRKLTLVVRNLVGNALKFTEQGVVRIEGELTPDRMILRVADTGIGIRPEDQTTIFEMFRQADQSDTRRYGGTGLGLYIVRRFVEQLGGTITLESRVGEGSVFTVTLPRLADVPPTRRAA